MNQVERMNMEKIKKLGIPGSFAICIPATIVMYCMIKYVIPFLGHVTGLETILSWFIVAGLGIFTPLIITGWLILKSEGYKITKNTWIQRLRFRKITKLDLIWCFVGLVLVGIFSITIMKSLEFYFILLLDGNC